MRTPLRYICLVALLVIGDATLGSINPRHIALIRDAKLHEVAATNSLTNAGAHARAPKVPRNVAHENMFSNPKATKFYVDGKTIPEVDFDVGPSWAGLLPISSDPKESRKLFFWYYPPSKFAPKQADDSLVFWTNGGPGCSSMEGIAQENGPWSWPWGTYKPVRNEWSWTNQSHVLWVEQPVGTGYSQGTPNIHNESELAKQLAGFLQQFLNVFAELKGKDFYVTGESYAGYYVPYIADQILHKKPTLPLKLKGIMTVDGVLGSTTMHQQIPAYGFLKRYEDVFALTKVQMKELEQMATTCKFIDYAKKYLTYPPKGRLPTLEVGKNCDIWTKILDYTLVVNPAFNIYRIFDVWPILWDIMMRTYPNAQSKPIYFNRKDVKKILHVPTTTEWAECAADPVFVNDTDNSLPSAYGPLPRVVDALDRTIIIHGLADYVVIAQGTALVIQNMTWGGKQGFQRAPTPDNFYTLTPTGNASSGHIHTERKLTYAEIKLSGHMVPQFSPWSATKLLKQLLGH